MNIVITGSNGFIGSALSARLAESGHRVIGISNSYSRRHPFNRCHEEYFRTGDQRIADVARRITSEIDVVIHCAALIAWEKDEWDAAIRCNVDDTRELAMWAQERHVGQFIFLSAGARWEFSTSPNDLIDETRIVVPPKSNPYAHSKYLAEEMLAAMASTMPTTIIYPTTVYGEGDMKRNSGALILLLRRLPLPIAFPGGTSWVSIRDLVLAIARVVEKPSTGLRRYIVSNGNQSYASLFETIYSALGRPRRVRVCFPTWVGTCMRQAWIRALCPRSLRGMMNPNIVDGLFRYRFFSTQKIQRELEWFPLDTLESCIRRATAFYDEH